MTRPRHVVDSSRHAKRAPKSLKKGLAGLAVATLAASGMVLANTAAHAAVPVTGTVFLDYGGDGAYTIGTDTLLGGVTVTAYDSNGDEVGSAITTVDLSTGTGNYTLDVAVDEGEPVRIEFTDLPAGMHDSFDAGQSGVQFITATMGATADYGVFDANQFIPVAPGETPNPTLATAIMVAGSRTHATVANEPVLVGTKWLVTENVTGEDGRWYDPQWGTGGENKQEVVPGHGSGQDPWLQRTEWATYEQVGSILSIASDSNTGDLYAAAAYKRFSQLGPRGLGGIYVVRGAIDPITGDENPNAPLISFDVTALGIDVGQNEIVGGPTADGNAAARGLSSPNTLFNDNDPFRLAAKVGIGDIAVDTDSRILYFVNLFDKKIYAIDISDPTNPQKLDAEIATNAGTNQQAYALTLHQGQLYVGYNDTGSTAFQPAQQAELQFFVDRVPALEDVDSSFGEWENVLNNGDLGYRKGNPAYGWGGGAGDTFANNGNEQILRWNTWTDSWNGAGSNSVGMASPWQPVHIYPQPLLSGITFDREGYMILGFMDRSQLQSGNRNCPAAGACDGTTGPLYQTLASGDTLIAAPRFNGDHSAYESWNLENNGVVTGDTGSRSTSRGGANEGPGNREFFEDRQWYPANNTDRGNHRENTLGAVIVIPGTSDSIASTSYDPLEPVRSVGVQWFDLQNGNSARGYQHTWDPGDPHFNQQDGVVRASFQKGGAMGGLSLISKAAPVEIGNYTWLDLNGDGVQDANEPGIDGATVELWRADAAGNPTGDEPIATKVTENGGHYFFRSENALSGGTPGFVADENGDYGDYVVVFKPGNGDVQLSWPGGQAPEGFQAPSWNSLEFTVPGVGEADDSQAAQRDSNADPATGNAPVRVGHAGQNDHSIDAGWVFGTVTVGDRVWIDENRNGTQDRDGEHYTEPGIEGVLLKIYRDDVEVTRDAFGHPFTWADENGDVRTDANGEYLFENLPVLPDGAFYEVRIVQDDEQTIAALDGYGPTESGAGDRDEDSSDWSERTQGLTAPGDRDLTLDFGFVLLEPSAIILKGDGDGNKADRAEDSVDLTTSGNDPGTTTLAYEIVNNGDEDLREVVVTDKVTVGDATVENLVCTFPNEGEPTAGEQDGDGVWTVRWAESFDSDGPVLPRGASFECSATLSGVIGAHENVATIDAIGSVSGESIPEKPFTPPVGDPEDPENPGTPEQPGTDNPYNAHRTPAVSVGDRVWFDSDADGEQNRDNDGGYTEPGIDGVVLEILDPNGDPAVDVFGDPVANQTTRNGGIYGFENLPVLDEGQSYTVRIVHDDPSTVAALAPYKPTAAGDGNGAGEYDSSTDEAESQSDLTEHGANDSTLDFGFVLKTPGANVVKMDNAGRDANTAEDAVDLGPVGGETEIVFTIVNNGEDQEPITEIGLVDVSTGSGWIKYPIVLTLPDGSTFDLVDADARWDGQLAYGDTIIGRATLTGVAPGEPHANTVTLWAEGALTGKPVEDPENPSGDPENPNRPEDPYHAEYLTYAIGDYVWIDANGDGVQDEGEQPFTGRTQVRIWALDANGDRIGDTPVATTVTDDTGYYLFDELAAGDYEIEFQLPSGYFWTASPATGEGADETNDSNALWTEEDQEWAATVGITLGENSPLTLLGEQDGAAFEATQGIDQTWDAGIIRRVPNATIDKSDVAGETANDGGEVVDLGAAGETTIVFTIENTGAEPLKNIGLADVTTSGSGELQYPIVLTLPDGSEYELEDADARWNGSLARGATITGTAQLTGVKPGESHRNEVALHAEGTLSGDPVGEPEDPEDPESPNVPPTDEYNGRVPTYAIGDVVWIDANRNGVQGDEGDEPFADGMTVRLYEMVGGERELAGETTTDEHGRYLFDNLTAGVYEIEFDLPEEYFWTVANATAEGADDSNDSDARHDDERQATAVTDRIVLGSESSALTTEYDAQEFEATEGIDPTWDAGIVRMTYAIGDVVWIDRNENGRQDAGEAPIADLTVNLYRADENGDPVGDPIATEATDANGRYLFDELPSGDYVVEFVLPDGYKFTEQQAEGTHGANDSDADVTTGRTGMISLGAGNTALDPSYSDQEGWNATEGVDSTWDAGVIPESVSVGDYVWFDANRDGLQSDDESGIKGIRLTLTGPDGEPVTNVYGEPVESVETDENGFYEFTDLPVLAEGESYTVSISNVPEQYKPTAEGENGGAGENDSSTGEATSVRDLTEDGASDPTLDFGFVLKVPGAEVNKSDAAGNDANTVDEAVDLGPAAGTAGIVFTIENTGDEPLRNIGLEDVTTTGEGELQYPIVLRLPDGSSFELEDADARWDGVLEIGETITGTAQLTGVPVGQQSHTNVVTLHAEGTLTGNPVEDPDNPSGDPENPNRPSDPYNAEQLTYAIGDVVWVDRNQNGQQDADEAPIADVTVNLYDANGDLVASTETDDEGLYLFDELTAGDYTVEFVLPNGYKFTEQNAAGVPQGANSDADVNTGRTVVITLGADNGALDPNYEGQDFEATEGVDPTWDAGVIPESVSVGDFVWFDLNRDGVQNDGEPGIGEGVTLTITGPNGEPVTNVYGEPVEPVETDENGFYEFTDLPVLGDGESYTVTISNVPDRFTPTEEGVGDPATDSSTGSASSGPLTRDGANDPTLDFGFVLKTPGATVVKADENGNDANIADDAVDLSPSGETVIEFSIVNNGEEPITNIGLVDVTTAGSGELQYPIAVTTSEGQSFTLTSVEDRWDGELAIGEIATATAQLTGVVAGAPHANTVTLWADGALTGNPVEDPENPSGDPENPNRPEDPYHAVVKSYAIGDYVWIDQLHPNGTQDGDEPGLGGVTVRLLDATGNELAVTATGDNGYYQFDNLEPGDYQVQFDLPFGYVFIAPNQGDDDTIDSDALPIDGTDNTKGLTILVTLNDDNGHLTARDGVNATEGIDPTWDAGVRLAEVSVGDKVWKDTNRDGRQDPGEPGIPGVVLVIERSDGEPVSDVDGNTVGPVTTDEEGEYSFDRLPLLPEGVDYIVKVDYEESQDALGNYTPTTPGVGSPDSDSSTDQETARGLEKDGDRDDTLDFGFVEPSVTVGDRVWEDTNRDGRQNAGEPGIPGVVLELVGPDGEPVTDVFGNRVEPVTTDENGNYLFPNLPALGENESYTVKIDREASAEALEPFEPTVEGAGEDTARDSSTWESESTGLTSDGDKDLTLDFGFIRPTVSVGDKVWKDIDRDGVQDEGEPGIPGVVLTIEHCDGSPVLDVYGNTVSPVVTDRDGNYLFENLPVLPDNECYVVSIDREASKEALGNLIPTEPGQGDRGEDSSDWSERTQSLQNDGDKDLTLDFGFVVPKVSVGDRVWFDENGNGRQDSGEPGIKGVVLVIVGPNGKPVTDVYGNPVEPVTTDEAGNYLFEDLPALGSGESYTVYIDEEASRDALMGFLPTTPGVGDREKDSSTGSAQSQGLTADGESDLTLDFGFVLEDPEAPLPPSLGVTGAGLPILPLAGAALLLLFGGALALRGAMAKRRV